MDGLADALLELVWSHFLAVHQCAVANLVSRRWSRLVKRGPVVLPCELSARLEPFAIKSGSVSEGLCSLKALRVLDLCGPGVRSLSGFSDARGLESLQLSNASVEPFVLFGFLLKTGTAALSLVDVSGNFQGKGLRCPMLRALHVRGPDVDLETFLQHNPQLQKLHYVPWEAFEGPEPHLVFSEMNHAEVDVVSNLLPAVLGRSLVCLSLENDAQDQKRVSLALELVALTCPGLRFLRLGSESFVGDDDLRFLGRLPVLEVLELGAPATFGLRELGGLTSLRALRVSASMCLGRLIFAGLPPRLEWLDVCTSRAAEVVLGWVPESLRTLGLSSCTLQLPLDNHVEELRRVWSPRLLDKMPRLRRVRLPAPPARELRSTVDRLLEVRNIELIVGTTEGDCRVPRLGDHFTRTNFSTKF